MSTQWFCRIMGDEWGPMSAMELMAVARRGRMTRDDLVRHGVNGDWVRADTVRGLFDGPPWSVMSMQTTIHVTGAASVAIPLSLRRPPRPAARSVHVVHAKFWIWAGEQIAGPFSSRQIRRFAAIGKLEPDFLISNDRSRWFRVAEVKALRPEAADNREPTNCNGLGDGPTSTASTPMHHLTP